MRGSATGFPSLIPVLKRQLQSDIYNNFKAGESEMRPCNADIMTAEHLLQHCQLHDAMRRDM